MDSRLGPTIVIGGCGLLGSHLVAKLLKEPNCDSITVLSRNPTKNTHPGVEYEACDIADTKKLSDIIKRIQPRTIFHTSSLVGGDLNIPYAELKRVNVDGTNGLLSCIQETPSVRALVYTSTTGVCSGPQVMAKETAPYWKKLSGGCSPYWFSKALAEQAVLAANLSRPGFKTGALRPCSIYGIGDQTIVPNVIKAAQNGQTKVQIGDNSNDFDWVSAQGLATAHILLARALLDPSKAEGKVDGEAFNITDGEHHKFWDAFRMIFRAAGDKTRPEDVTVISAWTAGIMATVAEWAYAIFTLGRWRPTDLNLFVVNQMTREHTWDISKARTVLGYVPEPRLEEGLKESVEAELARQKSSS